jgi:RNA polymerase sigma-70 factor (ECF subfamily)
MWGIMFIMDLSDEEIIYKIQQGEISLFPAITNRYFDKIFHYTLKMHFGNIADAEDSTAETFYKAYRFINTYSISIPFSAWLYRIAKNTVIDALRKHKRQPKISLEKYLETHEEPVFDLKKNIYNEKILVDMFLDYLDEEERSLLTMYYLEDISVKELSDLYKMKENSISVKIKRIREKIRKLAEEKRITYYE